MNHVRLVHSQTKRRVGECTQLEHTQLEQPSRIALTWYSPPTGILSSIAISVARFNDLKASFISSIFGAMTAVCLLRCNVCCDCKISSIQGIRMFTAYPHCFRSAQDSRSRRVVAIAREGIQAVTGDRFTSTVQGSDGCTAPQMQVSRSASCSGFNQSTIATSSA